jgi:predicted DNA-binding transcriptional regulator AlpA
MGEQVSVQEDELWTVEDLARYFHVGKSTIWSWRARGFGPTALKISPGCVRWRPETVRQWAAEQNENPTP